MKKYDIIIIGGGGGTKFMGPALKLGLSVAIIEKEDLGGTCLNRGCIPSKMLIHPANVLTAARDMEKYSIHGEPDYSVDFAELVKRVSATVDEQSKNIAQSYTKNSAVDYYHTKAKFVEDKVIEVDGEKITGEAIFVAVGSRPMAPPIPGLLGTPYMTSREALRSEKLPEKLLVIGGGYIGCELGHVYQAMGAQTTFFVRGKYLDREDASIQKEFQSAFEKKHNTVYGSKDLSVEHDGKIFTITATDAAGKEEAYTGDALLVATGVLPNTDDLGLENTTITKNERGYIEVNEYLETAVSGVFALGDCIGKYLFRHSVNFEAEYLTQSLFENDPQDIRPIEYPPMPHAVFSHPEIGGVGLTEKEADEKGLDYIAVEHAYKNSAQGMARLPEEGLVKIIIDKKTQKVLGAHIIGDEAATMVHEFILAMTIGATVDDLLRMIYIHPALPEIARNALRKAREQLS